MGHQDAASLCTKSPRSHCMHEPSVAVLTACDVPRDDAWWPAQPWMPTTVARLHTVSRVFPLTAERCAEVLWPPDAGNGNAKFTHDRRTRRPLRSWAGSGVAGDRAVLQNPMTLGIEIAGVRNGRTQILRYTVLLPAEGATLEPAQKGQSDSIQRRDEMEHFEFILRSTHCRKWLEIRRLAHRM